jgi:hypothetical protein
VNTTAEDKALPLEGIDPSSVRCEITDRHRRMEEAALIRAGKLHMPGESMAYLAW